MNGRWLSGGFPVRTLVSSLVVAAILGAGCGEDACRYDSDQITVTAKAVAPSGTPAASVPVDFTVRVYNRRTGGSDDNGCTPVAVTDAIVTVTSPTSLTLAHVDGGFYAGTLTGYATQIGLRVVSSGRTQERTLSGPRLHALSLTPSVPDSTTDLQVAWAPSLETDVSADLYLYPAAAEPGDDSLFWAESVDDASPLTVPASELAALPAGEYRVEVLRAKDLEYGLTLWLTVSEAFTLP